MRSEERGEEEEGERGMRREERGGRRRREERGGRCTFPSVLVVTSSVPLLLISQRI